MNGTGPRPMAKDMTKDKMAMLAKITRLASSPNPTATRDIKAPAMESWSRDFRPMRLEGIEWGSMHGRKQGVDSRR